MPRTNSAQLLYLMKSSNGLLKVGISSSPERRRQQVQAASGLPTTLVKVWDTGRESAFTVEKRVHKGLAEFRQMGEWFVGPAERDLAAFIERCIQPKWEGHYLSDGFCLPIRSRLDLVRAATKQTNHWQRMKFHLGAEALLEWVDDNLSEFDFIGKTSSPGEDWEGDAEEVQNCVKLICGIGLFHENFYSVQPIAYDFLSLFRAPVVVNPELDNMWLYESGILYES